MLSKPLDPEAAKEVVRVRSIQAKCHSYLESKHFTQDVRSNSASVRSVTMRPTVGSMEVLLSRESKTLSNTVNAYRHMLVSRARAFFFPRSDGLLFLPEAKHEAAAANLMHFQDCVHSVCIPPGEPAFPSRERRRVQQERQLLDDDKGDGGDGGDGARGDDDDDDDETRQELEERGEAPKKRARGGGGGAAAAAAARRLQRL
jgi:hypothetical protein